MQIVVVGLNHRTASVELRERMAFSSEQAQDAAVQIRSRGLLNEVVVLSTCNRTELYGVPNGHVDGAAALEVFFASYHKIPRKETRGVFYRHFNREAVRHVFHVAAGLDSMLLGEAEILGQVRKAYHSAHDQGSTGRMLNRLFQSAIEVGKLVRTETGIGMHSMSIAYAGVKLAERILPSFKDRRVLILGAGSTSEKALRRLCDRGIRQIRILNRTAKRAEDLATRYGGEAVSGQSLHKTLVWPDLVVASVSCSKPVLTWELLRQTMAARGNRPLVMIDLGIPRNVAPDVTNLANVHLCNIDHLKEIISKNIKARERAIPQAEAIIDEHIENFSRWHAGLSACSMLEDLRSGAEVDRETFLRKHSEAISNYSERERTYVIELLKKFMKGALPADVGCVRDRPDMWSKLRDLEALCGSLDDLQGQSR
jgi:glutamyl-tRNA reductase